MKNLRESLFLKMFTLFMAFSIFGVSCKQSLDTVNTFSEESTDEIVREYEGSLSPEECAELSKSIKDVKAFVWMQRSNGINPTRTDIANFVYNKNVRDGVVEPDEEARETLVKMIELTNWGGDQTAAIEKLAEENLLSSDFAVILQEFKANMLDVKSYNEAYNLIDKNQSDVDLLTLSNFEKEAFRKALDGAENSVCIQESSDFEINTRELCEECEWQQHWEELVVSIVITVAIIILAFLTLGLSLIWTSTILVTVWATTWALICIWVWCDEQKVCDEGLEPTCEGSFTFDESIPACTNASFPSNTFQFGNCIFSPKPNSGICPPSTTAAGLNCLWECFTETPVKNEKGEWQLPFLCK